MKGIYTHIYIYIYNTRLACIPFIQNIPHRYIHHPSLLLLLLPRLRNHPKHQLPPRNNLLALRNQLIHIPVAAHIPPAQPRPLLARQPHAKRPGQALVVAEERVPPWTLVVLGLWREDGAGVAAVEIGLVGWVGG